MTPAFRRIALLGKVGSPQISASLRSLHAILEQQGCEIMVEDAAIDAVGGTASAGDFERIGGWAELAIVVGGDGTMLWAARNLVRHRVALTGINRGRVGFMTDIALDDMRRSIEAILRGDYTMQERTLLDAEIRRGDTVLLRTLALNEAVVGKGAQGRLIEFEVHLDGDYLYTLRADGLIVATPTGSTAYALSAQGPILHPSVPALALVPLNPHTLSARPVSVSDRSVIEVTLLRALDARAHFDGFALADMAQGDRLLLRRSTDTIRFVHPPGYSYFAMLRDKLRWSDSALRASSRDAAPPSKTGD